MVWKRLRCPCRCISCLPSVHRRWAQNTASQSFALSDRPSAQTSILSFRLCRLNSMPLQKFLYYSYYAGNLPFLPILSTELQGIVSHSLILCKNRSETIWRPINSMADPSRGVVGTPRLLALSEEPILSIQVPQLASLPPNTKPVVGWMPIWLLKPLSTMWASISLPALRSRKTRPWKWTVKASCMTACSSWS